MRFHGHVIVVCALALQAAGAPASPRRTESPKNDRRWEESSAIESILEETDALPPAVVPSKGRAPRLQAARLPRFSVNVMVPYRATHPSLESLKKTVAARPERYALIRAVLAAMETLEKHGYALADALSGREVPAKLKVKIFKDQRMVAASMHAVREALDDLERAGVERDREPSRRWQANYDFVRARLMMRLVFLHEHNLMLAMARRGTLPPLADGQTGWRIVSVSGLHSTERDIKLLNAKAKAALSTLIEEHPGTPWAYLAKRDREVWLGLNWVPAH